MQVIWDAIFGFLYDIIAGVMSLLPDSPLQEIVVDLKDGPFKNIMNYINYFVPIGPMLGILASYLAAVAIWYVARWALRLARYIE